MHLIDVSNKAQETEDIDLLAWNQFYKAILGFKESSADSYALLDFVMSVRRGNEADEAKMIFHAFLFLAGMNTCPIGVSLDRFFLHSRHFPVSIVHQGIPPVDRVWNMVRASSELSNPFVLNQISCRQLEFFSSDEKLAQLNTNRICEANIALSLDLSVYFASAIFPSSVVSDFPDLSAHLNKSLERPIKDESFEGLDTLFDPLRMGAIFREISSLLIVSNGRIHKARVLLRLARLFNSLNRETQALFLLEDIETTILANCQLFDVGLFHLCKAHCLLGLGKVNIDTLKCVQNAITALGKTVNKIVFIECIVLAALISRQLGLDTVQFYSDMYTAVMSGAEHMGAQPELPVTVITQEVFPLSPLGQGRGVQTLIAWSKHN